MIVDCYSRVLSSAELNYDVRDKELLTVKFALEKWHHYCSNTEVTVFTDHRSLQHLKTMKLEGSVVQKRRLSRWWSDTLSRYNLRWVYKPGQYHVAPDALSRMHIVGMVRVSKSSKDGSGLIQWENGSTEDFGFDFVVSESGFRPEVTGHGSFGSAVSESGFRSES
eukprot:m.175669 g.175669  ORF g.175669 m.175669 type:complete len:166 (-) comp16786_c5_seq1:37-534(-)